jgi:hypothetical protein
MFQKSEQIAWCRLFLMERVEKYFIRTLCNCCRPALVFLALWHACCLIAYMIHVVYCAVQYNVYYLTQVLYIHLSSLDGPVPIWL